MMSNTESEKFNKKDFRVDKYINSLVQECVGGAELQQRKVQIQKFSDQTSSSLKKHVYANYMQFIETAKEISHLESEMYQLSHILIEQRNLLLSLGGDGANKPDEEESENDDDETIDDGQNQQAIRTVQEMVQGFHSNLDGKTFINDGALIELDSNDYRPIQRVFFFLFNDLLIVSKVKHDKKLELVNQYDPRKIAVINIKDLDGVKNAINIITSDGSKIFQCITIAAKNEWIEKFEFALKFNQQTNSTNLKHKKGPAPQPPSLHKQISSIDTKSIMSTDTAITPTDDNGSENWAPEWLTVSPEEIQASIAQRHFEEALSLIQKSDEYIASDSTFWNAAEISGKLKNLKTNLANVLIHELSNCQSRCLQAALRSSRRPLKLLAEMGKARQACGTLLKVCTNAIRSSQREARRNNAEISELFFCDLSQVASEFLKAFNGQAACVSALVVWCNTELRYFASQLIKHYLTKGSQLEVVAKCVEGVRKPCAKLTEIGLDLSYHVEGLLRTTLEQIIEESRYRLLETIGRTEDAWQPYNLQTKSHLKNLLRELDNLKLEVTGDTWINLTQSTVNFCRHFLSVTESCGYLAKNEALKLNVELLLRDLFLAQHAVNPNPGITVDPNFVAKNKIYLVEKLLPVAIEKFEKISGTKNEILTDLKNQMRLGPPRPKPRSVYQTDVL